MIKFSCCVADWRILYKGCCFKDFWWHIIATGGEVAWKQGPINNTPKRTLRPFTHNV